MAFQTKSENFSQALENLTKIYPDYQKRFAKADKETNRLISARVDSWKKVEALESKIKAGLEKEPKLSGARDKSRQDQKLNSLRDEWDTAITEAEAISKRSWEIAERRNESEARAERYSSFIRGEIARFSDQTTLKKELQKDHPLFIKKVLEERLRTLIKGSLEI